MHRVFVVDDHPHMRQNYSALIGSEHSLQVCGEAASGVEALEKIADAAPDLVVLDVSLAGDMDGTELLQRLLSTNAGLRILVVSGYDEAAFAERVVALGASGYVAKGDANAFLQAIRQVITPNTPS